VSPDRDAAEQNKYQRFGDKVLIFVRGCNKDC
jgi:hypothetical protein